METDSNSNRFQLKSDTNKDQMYLASNKKTPTIEKTKSTSRQTVANQASKS